MDAFELFFLLNTFTGSTGLCSLIYALSMIEILVLLIVLT